MKIYKNPFFYLSVILASFLVWQIASFVLANSYIGPTASPTGGMPAKPLTTSNETEIKEGSLKFQIGTGQFVQVSSSSVNLDNGGNIAPIPGGGVSISAGSGPIIFNTNRLVNFNAALGLKLPKVGTLPSVVAADEGTLIYKTDAKQLQLWNGAAWGPITGSGGSAFWQVGKTGSNNIFYDAGKVGIGLNPDDTKLNVKNYLDAVGDLFGLKLDNNRFVSLYTVEEKDIKAPGGPSCSNADDRPIACTGFGGAYCLLKFNSFLRKQETECDGFVPGSCVAICAGIRNNIGTITENTGGPQTGSLFSPGTPLVNDLHTVGDCEKIGGTAILDPSSTPGNTKIFCKVPGADCPVGWTDYLVNFAGWTETRSQSCSDSASFTTCTTGSHRFAYDVPSETCSYGSKNSLLCKATIAALSCF